MDLFHHAVEDVCGLVDLLVDGCTIRRLLNGVH